MTEQWQELKETIIELRDNDGTGTQQEACKFLANLMDVLEKQMQEPKTGHCKDCKWWKDSDGVYRRGVHAESECPINTKVVLDGEGYCYMFSKNEVR